jgi:hypothetical protein
MMVGMLVAGVGLVVAGLAAIGYGFTIKEFSTGNTLIICGVIGVCTGAIMAGLLMAVRELQNIARRLGGGVAQARGEVAVRPVLPPGLSREPASGEAGFPFSQEAAQHGGGVEAAAPSSPPPWQDEAATRERAEAPAELEPAEAAPAKPKRNLLFSSSSRKERERAQSRTSEPLPPDLLSPDLRPNPSAAPPPPLPPAEPPPPPPSFDDAWPKPERSKPDEVPPQRRPLRPPATPTEPNGLRGGEQAAVTVLKSGVVDGMAYSLYSDGSIEAQMPEGMMRFASIDELRSHLDQRP